MIENNDSNLDTEQNPLSSPSSPKKISTTTIITIFLLLFSYVGIIFASYQFGLSKNNNSNNNSNNLPSQPSPFPTTISQVSLTPTNPVEGVPGFGEITWLSSPKNIAIPDFFDKDEKSEYLIDLAKFYQIATFSDGSTLNNIIIEDSNGMVGGIEIHRIIKKPSGEYYLINESDDYFISIFNPDIVKSVNVKIPELELPESINLSKFSLKKNDYNDDSFIEFTDLKNPVLLEETSYGKIYTVYESIPGYSAIGNRTFYLLLKDKTVVEYVNSFDFMTDDGISKITFSDNTINKSAYHKGISGTGCGSLVGDVVLSNNISINSLKKIGTVETSQKSKDIYKIIDANNTILGIIYKEYKVGRDTNDPSFISDINKFIESPTHFLWKNDYGDWYIFTNTEYSALAECAKPVIYLYPEKPTQVLVKVGADITKSEPLYPLNGWDVFAYPNGQLDYQGQSYSSLFWDGTGHGLYPDINNRGVVVSQAELTPTIKKHLSLQGLNQQETTDFLEFWQSKLPTTPYVRLSWLTTAEINKLAPLKVTPYPDTIIRVFLDFEGLEKPIKLVPQQFITPLRHGFTLVEWGGLLIKD